MSADELTVALEQGDLELYYQPQVELASGRITGVEALIRWNHETRGLLMSADFIPIAERTGAVLPIGMRRAITTAGPCGRSKPRDCCAAAGSRLRAGRDRVSRLRPRNVRRKATRPQLPSERPRAMRLSRSP